MASVVAGYAKTDCPTYIEIIANSSREPETDFVSLQRIFTQSCEIKVKMERQRKP